MQPTCFVMHHLIDYFVNKGHFRNTDGSWQGKKHGGPCFIDECYKMLNLTTKSHILLIVSHVRAHHGVI